jgi:hypothetical protein
LKRENRGKTIKDVEKGKKLGRMKHYARTEDYDEAMEDIENQGLRQWVLK